MKRTILPALLLSGLSCASTVLADAKPDANALPIGTRFTVSARFEPSTAVVGQSVTFSYNASTTAWCDVYGVPGFSGGGRTGSYTFTATQALSADVSCESADRFASARANLSVTSDPVPTLSVAYSPSSILAGQSSTFSWSAQYANSCSSTGLNNVTGTSGSQVVAPGQGTYSTTVTCTGAGGSVTRSANLAVNSSQPAPTVSFYASPEWLWSSGYTTLYWNATNATFCSSPYTATSGSRSQFVKYSQDFWITCSGAGGTTSANAYVTVGDTIPPVAPLDKKATASLSGLGIDLSKPGMQASATDLNADGAKDLVVVDTLRGEAQVLLSDKGQFVKRGHTVSGVNHLRDIKSIFVPASNKAGIKVGVEK